MHAQSLPLGVSLFCAALQLGCGSPAEASSSSESSGASTTGSTTAGASAEATSEPTGGADSETTADAGTTSDDVGTTDPTAGDSSSDEGSDETTTGPVDEPNVLHVRSDGADANPGTQAEPMRTIQGAIAVAEDRGDVDTIRVAEGDYGFDYANGTHIVVADGVSLYGGYRSDWGDRDPLVYRTNIVDQSTDFIPSGEASPHRAIDVPEGVTVDTVIDGFHVGLATGAYRAAIRLSGAATISNNVITVEVVSLVVLQHHWGIYVDGSDSVIAGNRIGWSGDDTVATGIELRDGDALVANNIIDLDGVTASGRGIRISLGSPRIIANTIAMPGATGSMGIQFDSSASPAIDGNIIDASGGSCLHQNGESTPTSLRGNLLNCTYTIHAINIPTPYTYGSVAELEASIAVASGNVKLPQSVVLGVPDFMLDGSVLCAVARSELDVSVDVPEDIDGLVRTDPVSMGAHEWDCGCI